MAKTVTDKLIDQVNDLKIKKLIGSGSKRSIAAVVKKVQNGERWTGKHVAELLLGAANRISIDQDRQAVMALAAELNGASKPVQKATDATATVDPKPTKGKGISRAKKPVQAATALVTEDAKVYDDITALLDGNGIAVRIDYGPEGPSVHFSPDNGWSYIVWAPVFNMSGEDEWILHYIETDRLGHEEAADERFPGEAELTDWLMKDLDLKPLRKKRAVKPNSATNTALISSHLVTVASNVADALKLAQGTLTPLQIKQLKDMQASANGLRKSLNI